MEIVYVKKQYKIYKAKDGFIVHNTNKPFMRGHTHIKNFIFAKKLIGKAIKREVPTAINKFEVKSLIRISNNKAYINRLRLLL